MRYMLPGIRLSSGLWANAERELSAPPKVSSTHSGKGTVAPVMEVSRESSIWPNRATSRAVDQMPPSTIPVRALVQDEVAPGGWPS